MDSDGIKFELRLTRPIERTIEVETYGISQKIRGIPSENMAEEIMRALNVAIPNIVRKAGGQLSLEEATDGQERLKPVAVEEKKARGRRRK